MAAVEPARPDRQKQQYKQKPSGSKLLELYEDTAGKELKG